MEAGELIQERYLLEASLGKGGMAEVWRAVDRRLDRPVAIKFLAPRLTADPEFLVRFFSEAQSVAHISHPNVVSVLDFGESGDSPYLVMEYVPGGAVAGMTGEPVLAERAAEIVRDAALGAGVAHELGIVHRDIKPGNILICDDGRATIADFGIALTAFSEKLTATGQVIGSPHYISPEQASGKGSRPESDVYALGVVLYELLTGRPPFDADNATAIAIAHVDEAPAPPSTRGAEVTPELDALVLRCLAKDPTARFSNGTVLASALEHAVPSIAGLAPLMGAAALAGSPETADTAARTVVTSERDVVESRPARRGLLVAAGLALTALLATGAWAMLSDRRPDDSVAAAAEGEDRKKKPRPSPSASAYQNDDGEWVVTGATPTATPAPGEGEDRGEEASAADRNTGGGGNPGYNGGGEQEPEEPTTEHSPSPAESPTPQEEESTEPSPEPSEAPEEGP